MHQSDAGTTPAIKVWIASQVIVNQLIGFLGPDGFKPFIPSGALKGDINKALFYFDTY
jgi:hypothetical protein